MPTLNIVSKHFMLLFNDLYPGDKAEIILFQNIPCYCLTEYTQILLYSPLISKHPMLLFNMGMPKDNNAFIYLFQNILCYCLTEQALLLDNVVSEFQNILCYCLTAG